MKTLAVVETEVVAGKADDALDQVQGGVDGVVEDDDVAAMDGGGGEEAGGAVCELEAAVLFVDEEEVADEEGGLHRLGGDAEGLGGEGDDEDRDDDEVEERLERGEDAGLCGGVMDRLLAEWFSDGLANRSWDCFGWASGRRAGSGSGPRSGRI